MIKTVPDHPITVALSALAPVIGVNFELNSFRDDGGAADPNRFPRIDYAVILEEDSVYLPGVNLWRVTQTIQFDFVTTEADFLCQCKETRLSESQAIQAVQKSYTDKIRNFLTFLTRPTTVLPDLKEEDFVFTKYEWRFVRWITAFYFRRHGADQLTGATVRVALSFLNVDAALCCTAEELPDVQNLLTENSISWQLVENKINP